jgi:hypothetical protein
MERSEKGPRAGSFSVQQEFHSAAIDPERCHPNLNQLVNDFVSSTVRGPTCVYASGPGGMISDLREVVAPCNSGTKVWKGDERYGVKLINDDRLGW